MSKVYANELAYISMQDQEDGSILKESTESEVTINDSPEPWALFFQDNVTPQMEGLEELHNNIMFYLTLVLLSVPWIILIVLNLRYIKAKISNMDVVFCIIIIPLILMIVVFSWFKVLYLMKQGIYAAETLFSDPLPNSPGTGGSSPNQEGSGNLSPNNVPDSPNNNSDSSNGCPHGCDHDDSYSTGTYLNELCSICDEPWPTDRCTDCSCSFHINCHFDPESAAMATPVSGSPPHVSDLHNSSGEEGWDADLESSEEEPSKDVEPSSKRPRDEDTDSDEPLSKRIKSQDVKT